MSAADQRMQPVWSWPLAVLRQPIVVALILIVALLMLGETLSPGFASAQQIQRLLIVAAMLGIVAAGQNLVILGGREGIDLSVGGVVSIAAVLAGNIMAGGNAGIAPAIVACVGLGALFGLFNGLGVTLLRIPPLVMTLGMLGVLQGLLVVLRGGIPRAAPHPA
jgi:ribose transport system permease protein